SARWRLPRRRATPRRSPCAPVPERAGCIVPGRPQATAFGSNASRCTPWSTACEPASHDRCTSSQVNPCTPTCTAGEPPPGEAAAILAAVMRRLGLLLAAACPLAVAACGGSPTANKPPVRLSVDAPGDGTL